MGYPTPRVLPASQGLGCWGSELASGLFHHILLVEVNHWPVQVQRERDGRETHPFLMGDATELHQPRHGLCAQPTAGIQKCQEEVPVWGTFLLPLASPWHLWIVAGTRLQRPHLCGRAGVLRIRSVLLPRLWPKGPVMFQVAQEEGAW